MVQEKPVAVILAAGLGRRMGSGIAKPLVPVFGMPLIEHGLRALLSRNYRVVVVYHKEEVASFVKDNFPRVELVKNHYPERENGYSLYVASKVVDGDFLLVMSDHYYSQEFYDALPARFNETTAVVSDYCHDLQEATKVKVEGDRVLAIGKDIGEYDYFDTGMFLCKSEVMDYAKRLVSEKEKVRLAEIFQAVADDGKLTFLKVEGRWIDVDAPHEVGLAEKLIMDAIVKAEDGIVSRCINRPLSLRITKRLVSQRWATPNRLTLFSFFMGIFSAFLFAFGHPFWGGVWAQITSVVDGCDGEIARIKHMRSKFGGVLDSVTDRYVDALIMLGVALGTGSVGSVLLPLFVSATGVIMFSYVWHLTRIRVRLGGRDMRLLLVMVGGVLGSISKNFLVLLMWVVGLLSHGCALVSLLRLSAEKNSNS